MSDKINIENELKSSQLYELLERIQLEGVWPMLQQAHITQLSHFNYVKPKDLEALGMSKPAIRRLLDAVAKFKKLPGPPRPPAPPAQLSSQSKLYNKNLNATALITNKIFNTSNKKAATDSVASSVSVIISPQDIEILKDRKGQDEILGKGNFGLVKKALWSSHTGAKLQVAVKCLHNSTESDGVTDLINEISCMCGLDHRNLIKLYGIVLNSSNLMMVTELAPNGSLYNYLKKKREKKLLMPINKLYSYVFQIASGMEYLEMKKLIHRDLAARNILLYTYDHVKICDFGMTRSVKNEHNETFTMRENHKIPAAWFPPESIREKVFSIKSDVWMFGVTIWEIFSLCEHPWPNLSAAQILNKIDNESQRLALPNLCSKNFYNIVNQCWSRNPADRPTFQILRKLIQATKIVEMKARSEYKEEERLEINLNDMITVIDGDAAKYWWKGQNNRTLQVGYFPRAILNPLRKLNSQDISLPLKNSFIHTGHMGPSCSEKTWGNPSKIDPIFLMSMPPPDLLVDLNEDEQKKQEEEQSVKIVDSILSSQSDQSASQDLIDLLDFNSDTIQISYPDYSGSIDSFSSFYDYDSSNQIRQSTNVANVVNTVSHNQLEYVNDKCNIDDYAANTNTQVYYNDNAARLNKAYQAREYPQYQKQVMIQPAQQLPQQHQSNRNVMPSQLSAYQLVKNPFHDDIRELGARKSEINLRRFSQPACAEPSKLLDVDDFYKKVCDDVMNDFNSLKFNKQ